MYKLVIGLTGRCNLKCIWCCTPVGLTQTLSFEDFVYSINKYKPYWVALTGGETLLYKDIFRAIDYCKSKRKIVELCTNGTLITKSVAKKLNADVINISIDGLEEVNDSIRGKGSFKKTVRGIENLEKVGKSKRVVIVTALGKLNKNEPKKIIKYFYPQVKKFMLGRVIPIGKAKPEMCLKFKDALKIWASVQRFRINPLLQIRFAVQFWQLPSTAFSGPGILPNGDIAYCCAKINKIIGNIRTTDKLHSTSCLLCKGCGKS